MTLCSVASRYEDLQSASGRMSTATKLKNSHCFSTKAIFLYRPEAFLLWGHDVSQAYAEQFTLFIHYDELETLKTFRNQVLPFHFLG